MPSQLTRYPFGQRSSSLEEALGFCDVPPWSRPTMSQRMVSRRRPSSRATTARPSTTPTSAICEAAGRDPSGVIHWHPPARLPWGERRCSRANFATMSKRRLVAHTRPHWFAAEGGIDQASVQIFDADVVAAHSARSGLMTSCGCGPSCSISTSTAPGNAPEQSRRFGGPDPAGLPIPGRRTRPPGSPRCRSCLQCTLSMIGWVKLNRVVGNSSRSRCPGGDQTPACRELASRLLAGLRPDHHLDAARRERIGARCRCGPPGGDELDIG